MTAPATAAVVTGAARGIGRAIAARLAADHAVVCVDLDPRVTETAAAITAGGGTAVPVVVDLREDASPAAVAAALDDLAVPLKVLVNNAGITRDALVTKMSEDDFCAVLDVNLGAAWALTEHLLDRLVDGAAIVNTSSRSYLGSVGQYNYAMSKGGLVGLTRALALSLAPRVRVNAVAPGLTATEMTMAMPDDVRDKLVAAIPLGRMGQPAEIAEVVAALAGDALSYVTGQVLLACGGRSL